MGVLRAINNSLVMAARALAQFLWDEMRLELSPEKPLITWPEYGFVFLGYRVVRTKSYKNGNMVGNLCIPTDKLKALRREIKRSTSRATLVLPLKDPTLAFSREYIEQWDASYNSEPPAVDILLCRMTSSQSSLFYSRRRRANNLCC